MSNTATQGTLDYVLMGRTALDRIERLTAETTKKIAMCREAWRDYGLALLGGRQQYPSDNAFGAWVKSSGLDTGLAKSSVVRSDAMWMARNWDSGLKTFKPTRHHPVDVRKECRDEGYAWAFDRRRKKNNHEDEEPDAPEDVPADRKADWADGIAQCEAVEYCEKYLQSKLDVEKCRRGLFRDHERRRFKAGLKAQYRLIENYLCELFAEDLELAEDSSPVDPRALN